ncbi:T9SS type A sorting domain-containing protein [Persicimonas caeni]|uniref:T9SS type A sorting domain-containing protein n=1 Tax=Persicimonas caeni TaxID=2292766 RepID=A0A4Y6PNM1_PERCE|nr:T9SS type A sorting domain-containing protein [Persicimonas caeni]QDG49902.1 T9SS type A sorting domain-containing protein [Persicimonas caeni]QED31123.1 T9SS type A sorting domain-containing protein [Persicimonas caeni]
MRAFFRRAFYSHEICVLALVALIGTLGMLPADLDAKSRDSDASRMQARKIGFPSNQSDSLKPPADRVDWSYFKLTEKARVSLTVEFSKAEVGGRVVLTSATGRELAASSQSGSKASLSASLAPGIYYVSVSASKAASYTLSVRE